MDIRLFIKKLFHVIPGGLMVVPLLSAIMINTYVPEFFEIGGLTTSLFNNGDLVLLGFLFFLVGTQFHLKQSLKTWKTGAILIILKIAVGSLAALSILYFFGVKGVFGITPLVLLIALTQSNIAMYIAIVLQFGRPAHLHSLPWFLLLETPLVTLLLLDISGMITTSLNDYFSMIIPFALGIGVGFLVEGQQHLFKTMIPVIIPFFAFSVGSHFQIYDLVNSQLGGLIIAIIVLFSGVLIFLLFLLFSKDEAILGIALGSTGSTSLFIVPILSSLGNDRYTVLMPTINAQLITITILTCIFSPVVAKILIKNEGTSNLMKNNLK
ncbi:2-keto-3-deoxygluconate permease [Aquibacillus sp. 3ASR75-11]|uniref:2-keto-3-deoxygluconate permease n=1 Tax=Terrihalobacillus insolitus TaxID=2950438 RepID=A0A9X3WQL1_9BACI|nr:2-keto-3-deoxygluconate permease [Terrihalobacillus insolitus]MDC3412248.1 2-keto-3-deoxygluconate permease [Terrihalobacillus insolitus]MDC3423058.1 2-keto-3-deoxygluconate permease [Terrihalobacillus insolitus]